MSGLVTAAMLAKARSIGYRQLVTPVTIQRQVVSETPYGSQTSWVTVGTANGWLRNMNTPSLAIQIGVVGALTTYRLHLPQGTDILEADQVVIGGDRYVVQNVNSEDTIQVFTTAVLRRIE